MGKQPEAETLQTNSVPQWTQSTQKNYDIEDVMKKTKELLKRTFDGVRRAKYERILG